MTDHEPPTVAEIQADLACSTEQAERAQALAIAGFRHGRKGWYPDGEFASDADWVYGTGAEIRALAEDLENTGVIESEFGHEYLSGLYEGGHSAGLQVWQETQ